MSRAGVLASFVKKLYALKLHPSSNLPVPPGLGFLRLKGQNHRKLFPVSSVLMSVTAFTQRTVTGVSPCPCETCFLTSAFLYACSAAIPLSLPRPSSCLLWASAPTRRSSLSSTRFCCAPRSEERRVGKEGRCRRSPHH